MRSTPISRPSPLARRLAVATAIAAVCMAAPACSSRSDGGSSPSGTAHSGGSAIPGGASTTSADASIGKQDPLDSAEPAVGDACPLLTDDEVTAVYPATGPGGEDRDNEALTYCIWPAGTTGDTMLLEVKGLTADTLDKFRATDEGLVESGNKELLAGLGDFATYDPSLASVTVYVGQISVSILANPVLGEDALATLATTAVSRLN